MDQPLMRAERVAVGVDKPSLRGINPRIVPDKGSVIAVRDKADILAIRLLRIDKTMLHCNGAYLVLAQIPQREQHMRKLLLRELIEDIGLILPLIRRLFEKPAPGLPVPLHTGVMPGGHRVKSAGKRLIQQRAKFDRPVTIDAGIRRVPRAVFADKTVNHLFAETVEEWEHLVRKAEELCHAACILNIGGSAAGTVLFRLFSGK